jgi:hypothetical protein
MAYTSELAPNSSDNHQGRLAWTPTDLLPPIVTGPIFDQAQEHSLVMKLGRSIPVQYGETVIPTTTKRPEVGQVGSGTSNAQREGGVKPLSGTAWDTKSFSPIKLATIVTVSEEFATRNPMGLYTQIQSDLAYAIGRGIDLAVIHGKSPLTGGALSGIDSSNIIANTANALNLEDGQLYNGLLDGYDLVNQNYHSEFSGWAVDPRFRTKMLRESIVTAFGTPNAPAVNVSGAAAVDLSTTTSQVLGLTAHYGRGVGGDLGAATDSGIRVIGGDFSQLAYGFADQVSVRTTRDATLVDGNNQSVSLFQTNQIAILIEVTFGWVLGHQDAFVKFTNTGNASYNVALGGATAGTYVLKVNGLSSSAIAYNATAATIKAAIVAIDDGFTTSNVTVTGTGPFTVTVPGVLTADFTGLTGATSPAVTAV